MCSYCKSEVSNRIEWTGFAPMGHSRLHLTYSSSQRLHWWKAPTSEAIVIRRETYVPLVWGGGGSGRSGKPEASRTRNVTRRQSACTIRLPNDSIGAASLTEPGGRAVAPGGTAGPPGGTEGPPTLHTPLQLPLKPLLCPLGDCWPSEGPPVSLLIPVSFLKGANIEKRFGALWGRLHYCRIVSLIT